MKIEVDLNDIFCSPETGQPEESVEQAIQRQIVEQLTKTMRDGVKRKVDEEISKQLTELVQAEIATRIPEIVGDALDFEFYTVTSWGSISKESTSIRKEIVSAVQKQIKYDPKRYESENNAFTKAVKAIADEAFGRFRKEFDSAVNADLQKQAMDYAVTALQQKFRLS